MDDFSKRKDKFMSSFYASDIKQIIKLYICFHFSGSSAANDIACESQIGFVLTKGGADPSGRAD